jgi:hypothetical protein
VLCLCSSIAGCKLIPDPVIEYVPVLIPAPLLVDCPVPAWSGGTYRDLAALSLRREAALLDCNARWAALRRYQDGLTTSSPATDD